MEVSVGWGMFHFIKCKNIITLLSWHGGQSRVCILIKFLHHIVWAYHKLHQIYHYYKCILHGMVNKNKYKHSHRKN